MTFQPHIISPIVGGMVRSEPRLFIQAQLSQGLCIIPLRVPLRKELAGPYKVLLRACGLGTDYDPSLELAERVLAECIVAEYRFRFNKVRRQVLDRYKKPIPDTWAEAFYLKEQIK